MRGISKEYLILGMLLIVITTVGCTGGKAKHATFEDFRPMSFNSIDVWVSDEDAFYVLWSGVPGYYYFEPIEIQDNTYEISLFGDKINITFAEQNAAFATYQIPKYMRDRYGETGLNEGKWEEVSKEEMEKEWELIRTGNTKNLR